MKKRLIVMAGMLALSVGVTLLVLWLLQARPAVTEANFDRIEIGMTRTEVEDFIGPDNGNRFIMVDITGRMPVGQVEEAWGGNDGTVWLIFDEQKGVVSKEWHDSPLPFLDRLQRKLPWLPI